MTPDASYLTMQAPGLQQSTEKGGSPLVVGSLVGQEVGLIGGPVDGVQAVAEGVL